jgi:hypothetical protein
MQQIGIHGTKKPFDGRSRTTYRQLVHLIELAAAELRGPDFGMRLATLQSGSGMFGPLGLVMKNSTTFGDALDYVRKHTYAHSLAARIWLKRSRSMNTVFGPPDCAHRCACSRNRVRRRRSSSFS